LKIKIMRKKYVAGTLVHINVVMEDGKRWHVSFTPSDRGGSYFVTDNEKLQEKLENHPRYGTLFKLERLFRK